MRTALALPLLLGLCAPDETISGHADRDTTWHLTELNGVPAAFEATLRFPEAGRVVGTGPCNGFAARQGAPYPWIAIEAIVATRRACPDLDGEAAFFRALGAAKLVEASDAMLLLTDDLGRVTAFEAR